MKFPKIKFNKTWAVLGIALVIGSIAAFAARNYLTGQMAAIEARGKGETVKVVVAKRPLTRGELITSDNVAVRSVPLDYAHSSAMRPDQMDKFDGQTLAFGAKAGEMILWSMVEGKKVPTFSARVEVGRRAITVPVDEINSISGLLEPGDLVDLMVTINQKEKKFTFPLLQTVRVMATGQRQVDDPKSGERRQYSTVTLDATPEQAQTIIVAREAGKITALLRNPIDTKEFRGGNIDLVSMLGFKPEGDLKQVEHALAVRQIPVLYGGRGAKLPPEGLQMGQYVQSGTVNAPAMVPDTLPAVAPVVADPPPAVKVLTAPSVRQP